MNQSNAWILGAIAGGAIFIGIPIARIRRPAPRLRIFLSTFATGVLLFLLVDVMIHAFEPVEEAFAGLHEAKGSLISALGWATLMLGSLAVGLLSLVHYNKYLADRGAAIAAAPPTEKAPSVGWFHLLSPSRQTAFLIAMGIGLHNLAEGLAIGQSAAMGSVSLSTVLVVGFALHNATEGFGISAPMAGDSDRPPWRYLLLLGMIAGGPTVIGAGVGGWFTSTIASVAFLSLAAGSILFVILQLLSVAFRQQRPLILGWGIMAGLAVGFGTDLIVVAAGA